MATRSVPSHPPPSTTHSEETLARYLAQRSEVGDMIARNPRVSGVLLGRFLDAAALAELLGKPREVTLSCLAIALDAGMIAFRLAAGQGQIEVSLGDRRLAVASTGATDSTHPAAWQRLFGLSLALRRAAVTDAICAFDVNILRNSTAQVDDFRYDVVVAMQEFWKGGDWRAAATRVFERSQPQFTKVAGREYVDVDVTQVKLLEPLDARDAPAFNAALVAALEAHKRYWGGKQWAGTVAGWIAAALGGLAALAHDRGLVIDVESGYMPGWLVRGELGV